MSDIERPETTAPFKEEIDKLFTGALFAEHGKYKSLPSDAHQLMATYTADEGMPYDWLQVCNWIQEEIIIMQRAQDDLLPSGFPEIEDPDVLVKFQLTDMNQRPIEVEVAGEKVAVVSRNFELTESMLRFWGRCREPRWFSADYSVGTAEYEGNIAYIKSMVDLEYLAAELDVPLIAEFTE